MKKSVLSVLLNLITITATCFGQAPAEAPEPAQAPPEIPANPANPEVAKKSPLEGAWKLIQAWDGVDKEDDLGLWFEFIGDKILAHNEGDTDMGQFKIDVMKQQIIIVADKQMIKVLYKIDRGLLTMCYHEDGKELPKNFELEEGKALFRFKSMKPANKKFQGKWKTVELWESGEKSDEEDLQDYSYHISAHLFEIFDNDELQEADGEEVEPDESFVMSINEKLNRMQLDDQMGVTYNCIYKFEKDILIIHFYDHSDAEGNNADYPKDFKITKNSILLKLKK